MRWNLRGPRTGVSDSQKFQVNMTPVEGNPKQSAVQRLASLPLVSSTCLLLSMVYCAAKETHPYVKSLCEVTESGARTIASLAVPGVKPVVNRLQSQIDSANDVACQCLDKVEEALPILHQPLAEVLANPSGVVAQARNGRVVLVDGAKHTLKAVLSKAGVMLHEAVGLTKVLVDGGMKALSGSPVVQLVSTKLKASLLKCETLIGCYLGLPEEQLEKVDGTTEVHETIPKKQSNYGFLSSISTRLQKKPTHQGAAGDEDCKPIESCTLVAPSRMTTPLQTTSFAVVSGLQSIFQSIQIGLFSALEDCHNLEKVSDHKAHSDNKGSAAKQPVHCELRNSLQVPASQRVPESKLPQFRRFKRSLVH